MTGLAIVLYLNQTPGQPRERDYAYAGSFYAFAIWIGMGAAGCCDMLRRKHFKVLPVSLLMLLCLLIPVQWQARLGTITTGATGILAVTLGLII